LEYSMYLSPLVGSFNKRSAKPRMFRELMD